MTKMTDDGPCKHGSMVCEVCAYYRGWKEAHESLKKAIERLGAYDGVDAPRKYIHRAEALALFGDQKTGGT